MVGCSVKMYVREVLVCFKFELPLRAQTRWFALYQWSTEKKWMAYDVLRDRKKMDGLYRKKMDGLWCAKRLLCHACQPHWWSQVAWTQNGSLALIAIFFQLSCLFFFFFETVDRKFTEKLLWVSILFHSQSCRLLHFWCNLLHPSALYFTVTPMQKLLHPPWFLWTFLHWTGGAIHQHGRISYLTY